MIALAPAPLALPAPTALLAIAQSQIDDVEATFREFIRTNVARADAALQQSSSTCAKLARFAPTWRTATCRCATFGRARSASGCVGWSRQAAHPEPSRRRL
jgi:hypothetical protein